jgi:hypothetical protein
MNPSSPGDPERHLLTDEEIMDLDPPPGVPSVDEDDPESVRAMVDLLNRRIADIESGRVKGIPAEEVHRKLREKYG